MSFKIPRVCIKGIKPRHFTTKKRAQAYFDKFAGKGSSMRIEICHVRQGLTFKEALVMCLDDSSNLIERIEVIKRYTPKASAKEK